MKMENTGTTPQKPAKPDEVEPFLKPALAKVTGLEVLTPLGVVKGPDDVEELPPLGVISAADRLKGWVAYTLLALFVASVATTYVIIFLWGCKVLTFPEPFIHWLGAATIGEVAGLFTLVVRNLFPPSHSK